MIEPDKYGYAQCARCSARRPVKHLVIESFAADGQCRERDFCNATLKMFDPDATPPARPSAMPR